MIIFLCFLTYIMFGALYCFLCARYINQSSLRELMLSWFFLWPIAIFVAVFFWCIDRGLDVLAWAGERWVKWCRKGMPD